MFQGKPHGSKANLVDENDPDYVITQSENELDIEDSISDSPDDSVSCDNNNEVTRRCHENDLKKKDTFKSSLKGILKRTISNRSNCSNVSISVDNLSDRDLEWLQGDHFLERLEHDEDLQPDVLQKEVDTLQRTKKKNKTCRHRMEHFLTSTPCQIIVLLIAFLDAVVVVTSVILDMESHRQETDYLKCQRQHLVQLFTELGYPELRGLNKSNTVYDLIEVLHAKIDKVNETSTKNKFLNGFTDLVNLGNATSPWTTSATREDLISPPGIPRMDDVTTAPPRSYKDVFLKESVSSYAAVEDLSLIWSKPPSLEYCKALTLRANYLKHISHLLHYTSIALLSVLLLEVILKVIAMGRSFFHHKLEIMDSIVIVVSFMLDLIFIDDHDKNIPAAIFLFIWQMLRILSALVNHDKKRIEFLMHVMKENNATMQKKNSLLMRKIKHRKKQLGNLQLFCEELGATDQQVKDTLAGVATQPQKRASMAKSVLTASWGALQSPFIGLKKKTYSRSVSVGGPVLPPLAGTCAMISPSAMLSRRRASTGTSSTAETERPTAIKCPVLLKSIEYNSSLRDFDLRQRRMRKQGTESLDGAHLGSSFEDGSELGSRGTCSGRESSIDSGSFYDPGSALSSPNASPAPTRGQDFVLDVEGIENRGYLGCDLEADRGYRTDGSMDFNFYGVKVSGGNRFKRPRHTSLPSEATVPSISVEDYDRCTKL